MILAVATLYYATPQRAATEVPLDQRTGSRRDPHADSRIGTLRCLRRTLQQLQQDLRCAGRGDRLPPVTLDHQSGTSVRCRARREAGTRTSAAGRNAGRATPAATSARHARGREERGQRRARPEARPRVATIQGRERLVLRRRRSSRVRFRLRPFGSPQAAELAGRVGDGYCWPCRRRPRRRRGDARRLRANEQLSPTHPGATAAKRLRRRHHAGSARHGRRDHRVRVRPRLTRSESPGLRRRRRRGRLRPADRARDGRLVRGLGKDVPRFHT
jgi:hypothetical protein